MPVSYNVKVDHFSRVLPEYVVTNQELFGRIRLHKLAAEIGEAAYLAIPEEDRPQLALAKFPLAMENFETNTRIRQRYQFGAKTSIVTKSIEVLRQALEEAGWDPSSLDFIIFSSVSNSYQNGAHKTPTVAGEVQEAVGAWNAWAYDMTAACSGWVYPVQQATAFIQSGMAKRGAVINTEMADYILDYTNEKSSSLIGDMAAVTLMSWSEEPGIFGLTCEANRSPAISSHVITWGHTKEIAGESFSPFTGPTTKSHKREKSGAFALMGKTVYAEGIKGMTRHTEANVALAASLFGRDPDWYVFHQANWSMLAKILDGLTIAPTKHLYNIDRMANTAGATIPSVLAESWGSLPVGDIISTAVFGGGVTSGRMLLRKVAP